MLTAILLLASTAAQAQASYCDQPQPGTGSAVAGSTLTLKACLGPNDANGVPIVSVSGWTVYDNTVSTALSLTKGATSMVSGLTLWSGTWIAPPMPGIHTLEVTDTSTNSSGVAKESPKSAPFVLTLSAAPAGSAAPVKLSVGP